MKTSRVSAIILWLALIFVLVLLAPSDSADATLQIEKAFCGVKGSWCDVTAFLQSKVRGDTLSTSISQPFSEIGDDPAWGQSKNLIIDYRLKGVSYQLALKEQNPVAFTVELPSSKAVPPGSEPQVTALIEDAKSSMSHTWAGWPWLGYGIALVSIIWAVVITIDLLEVERRLLKLAQKYDEAA